MIRLLALLPPLGIVLGPILFNRVEPLVLGMPLLMAWLVFCVLATSAAMALVHAADRRARRYAGEAG